MLKIVVNLWAVGDSTFGELKRSLDPLDGRERVAAPSSGPDPRSRPSALRSCPPMRMGTSLGDDNWAERNAVGTRTNFTMWGGDGCKTLTVCPL